MILSFIKDKIQLFLHFILYKLRFRHQYLVLLYHPIDYPFGINNMPQK